jgi:hypothetical protein
MSSEGGISNGGFNKNTFITTASRKEGGVVEKEYYSVSTVPYSNYRAKVQV